MISFNKVDLFLGGRRLYNEISAAIKKSDKIGLTGKNGAGKSTLLKIICGSQAVDGGNVAIDKEIRICYLPQEIISRSSLPIFDEVVKADQRLVDIEHNIESVNVELAERTDYESSYYLGLLDQLNDLNLSFNLLGGNDITEMAETLLKGLGFSQEELQRPMNEFSGGWQMRVELAKLLVQQPDVLLLDEPTNHLDIESIQWLEDYLKRFSGAIVLISHDKRFLDAITNRTIEISAGKLYDYKLNYSNYLVKREEELALQLQAYKNQQKMISHTEELIDKFRAKKNKAAFAQSLIKKLDKLDLVEVDKMDGSAVAFRFPEPSNSGNIILEANDLSKSFGDKEILKATGFTVAKGEKIALLGKNGQGKSTLIKMLVGDISYEGVVKLGHNVKLGYFAQDETAKMDVDLTVFETIDRVATGEVRKRIRAILGSFLFDEEAIDKKVKVLSGGEKTRLAICKLLLEPFNFLILDEPTNHLDIVSKEVLKKALKDYTGTLLLVSHDRDFLNGLSDRIYCIRNKGVSIYFDEVNEFLQKLNSFALHESAMVKEKSDTPISMEKTDVSLSFEERKHLKSSLRKTQNDINKTERSISDLELSISGMEKLIAENQFAAGFDLDAAYLKLAGNQKELEKAMQLWEQLASELEALERKFNSA